MGVGRVARVALAGLCGAVVAWTVAAFVLHAMFAAGGYTREALVEPPLWVFAATGLGGAVAAAGPATFVGRVALPWWVRPVAVGGLTGVAAVVLPVAAVACPAPKGHPLQAVGLAYGVPIGFAAGATVALVRAIRRRAEPTGAADRGPDGR